MVFLRDVLVCEILVNVITLYNICENCTAILVNIYIFIHQMQIIYLTECDLSIFSKMIA